MRLFLSPLFNNHKKENEGAILFVAVGAIVILSILALGATSSVVQELKLAKFLLDFNTSFYLASSTIEAMKVVLANDETPQHIILYDLRERLIPFGGKVASVSFFDEQNRVNINSAPKELLLGLPGIAGDEVLVDEIMAADVSVKEELLYLNGMTQEIYDEAKELVTTYPHGGANINTAGDDIFLTLGMGSSLIDKIEEFRAGEDGVEQTEDDSYFSSTSSIIPSLEPYGLTESQKTLLSSLVSSNLLTTTSDYVRFDIAIHRAGPEGEGVGRPDRKFHVVLRLSSGAIISWLEE